MSISGLITGGLISGSGSGTATPDPVVADGDVPFDLVGPAIVADGIISEPVSPGGRVDYYNDEGGVLKTLVTDDYRSIEIDVNISTIDGTQEITIPDAELTKVSSYTSFELPNEVAAVLRKWVLTVRSAETGKVLGNWELFGRYGARSL